MALRFPCSAALREAGERQPFASPSDEACVRLLDGGASGSGQREKKGRVIPLARLVFPLALIHEHGAGHPIQATRGANERHRRRACDTRPIAQTITTMTGPVKAFHRCTPVERTSSVRAARNE